MKKFRSWSAKAQNGLGKKAPKRQHSVAGLSPKIAVRQHLAEALPGASVLECFGGAGDLWRAVWKSVASDHVTCDQDWFSDERFAYVCDCRRLCRCLDLSRFTIFDLDPWGSPWEVACIIATRRHVAPGELIGFALTDGGSLSSRQSRLPRGLPTLTGLARDVRGVTYDEIVDLAIAGLAAAMQSEVQRRWQGRQRTGAQMRYIGLVLQGITPPLEDGAIP